MTKINVAPETAKPIVTPAPDTSKATVKPEVAQAVVEPVVTPAAAK